MVGLENQNEYNWNDILVTVCDLGGKSKKWMSDGHHLKM